MTRTERFKRFLRRNKGEIIMGSIIASFVLAIIFYIGYDLMYPCIKGHYEKEWVTNFCIDQNGYYHPCGGYFREVFVCDCRTKKADQ